MERTGSFVQNHPYGDRNKVAVTNRGNCGAYGRPPLERLAAAACSGTRMYGEGASVGTDMAGAAREPALRGELSVEEKATGGVARARATARASISSVRAVLAGQAHRRAPRRAVADVEEAVDNEAPRSDW